jgi:hypothetical protein
LKQLAVGSNEKILIMSIMEGSQNRRQQIWAVAEPPHIIVGMVPEIKNNKLSTICLPSLRFI